MRDHALEALSISKGKTRDDLDRDRVLLLALVKLVEIIGEAAGRVSEATRAGAPHVPWPQIIAMRNRLVHGYDRIDHDRLWKVISEEIEPLIAQLDRLLESPAR